MPATTSASAADPIDDSSSLLGRRPYAMFLAGRFLGTLATGSQAVVIAWMSTSSPGGPCRSPEAAFAVGMIGLAQFLPLFALTLIAGEAADRHDRRRILMLCYLTQFLTSLGWRPVLARRRALADLRHGLALRLRPGVFQPTAGALGPMLVPSPAAPEGDRDELADGAARAHPRPRPGRLLCVISPILGYAVSGGLYLAAAACALLIRGDTRPSFEAGRSRVAQIKGGSGIRLGKQACPRGHLAGSLRGPARRGDRPPAGLRPRRSRRGGRRDRPPAGFSRGRGASRRRLPRPTADPDPCRDQNVPCGRDLRGDDRCVFASRARPRSRCSPWR